MKLELAKRLEARTLPVLLSMVAIVAMSAPTAYYVVRVGEMRAAATITAGEAAVRLGRNAHHRPVLWRYHSAKVVEALYPLPHDVTHVLVLDDQDVEVASTGTVPDAVSWTLSPIPKGAGTVWVAVDLHEARMTAAWLALGFLLLGGVLAFVLWWLPRRALVDAEARIDGVMGDLEALNADLENQVQDRVADLERSYAELAERDRRIRELATKAVAVQESERRAIARELHDGAGQTLTAVRLHLQILDAEGIDRAVALLDEAINEVRRALETLAPAILEEVGLVPAIERLCATVADTSPVEVEHDLEDPGVDKAAVEATIYRVAQEALHNIVRHSGAEHASVSLSVDDERITLEVRDDGRGLDGSQHGRGLRGMVERAELLDGTLRLESSERGTRVVLEIPR